MLSLLKCAKCQRGQNTVEFSLVALVFLTVFFGIVEFSHVFYAKLSIQHALGEAGRYAITGRGIDPGDSAARLENVKDVFYNNLIGTGLSCPRSDFAVTCVGGSCTQPGGGPGQTVLVTVPCHKPWFLSFFGQFVPGGVDFELSTTWKNEPFSS